MSKMLALTRLSHRLRQLGDIHRDPPRLVASEQLVAQFSVFKIPNASEDFVERKLGMHSLAKPMHLNINSFVFV